MRTWTGILKLALPVALALAGGGCATAPVGDAPRAAPPRVDAALAARILALDPERISEGDVRDTLARGPTPQIIGLHGGIYPVHLAMTDFAEFLIGMGYPEAKVRHPGDGRYSHSPYESSEALAGLVAWYYERDGVRPMLVGHSQGGMQAVKVLHTLNGAFGDRVRVWNPLADAAEDRVTIVDPLTGGTRPVLGLSVAYATAVGAGGAAFLLPNQWSMAGRLRTIPDTVDEFTGFFLEVDLWAWNAPGSIEAQPYRQNGAATVRNVSLPANYNHVFVPVTSHLAGDPGMRSWINAYDPRRRDALPPPDGSSDNVLWAADVWHSIKKHWCLEAQRLVRAQRAGRATAGTVTAPARVQ
ncbi:MAG: hypothetical protein KJ025_07940 [Burkholderiales bacterium]|nr:hypothetical protein [Burkholderiales bacterium]